MKQPLKESLDFIQALRGIAALGIVLWHGSRYVAPYYTGVSAEFFYPAGTGGVDLFFIMSGFIIAHTTRMSDGSFRYVYNFFVKRVIRIWPIYVIAMFIYGFLIRQEWGCFSELLKAKWLVYSLLFIPMSGQAGAYPPAFGLPLLGVGWVLNYEMYFYAFFGLAMLFGRWRWLAFSIWVLMAIIVIPGASGYVDTWSTVLSPFVTYGFKYDFIKLFTNPMIWLFVAGVGIGLVYNSPLTINNAFYARIFLFSAITFTIWQYVGHIRPDHGILNWGLSFIPLVLILSITSKTIDLTVPKWLVYLGDISYSLYIFHPIAQEGFDKVVRFLGYGALSSGYSAMFLTTVISIIIAAISHRYFEKELCGYLREKMLKPQKAFSYDFRKG